MNITVQHLTSNYGVNIVTSIQDVSGYRLVEKIAKRRHILWVLSTHIFLHGCLSHGDSVWVWWLMAHPPDLLAPPLTKSWLRACNKLTQTTRQNKKGCECLTKQQRWNCFFWHSFRISHLQQGCLLIKGSITRVTLTLTRWPWYTNLSWTFGRCIYVPKVNFLGQRFTKLSSEKKRADRQTDRCPQKYTPVH